MKKTTSKRSRRTENNGNPHFNAESVKFLRTVQDSEAFYFYEAVGKPTGEFAKNLTEFLDKVKSVKSECLLFHFQRSDFHNWFEKTLGDDKLARKLAEIASTNSDEVRSNVCKTVENRLRELTKPTAAILVGQDTTAIVLSAH
ncbi:MAG TPA: DUF5752 family protein [Candidatus Bathyarchaeia archaeon]|nr:DUF5752 family protein [Candidatus Bathyarchaeia archaeon]